MKAIYAEIESRWASRCATQHYAKKDVLDRQAEFFAGVMTALLAVGVPDGEAIPPRWVMRVFSGDLIRPSTDEALPLDKKPLERLQELQTACQMFIDTVEATGGVLKAGGSPVGDPEWPDLGDAYCAVCEALGRPPLEVDDQEEEE